MPVISNIDLDLDLESVEKLRGVRGNNGLQPRIKALLPGLLSEINSKQLIVPLISYEIAQVNTVISDRIELHNGAVLQTPVLSQRLANASEIATGVITIGAAIGKTISHWFETGQALKAALMEEIANAFLFKLSDHFREIIDAEADKKGLEASGPLSPGDEGFDLGQQTIVMSLAQAEKTGISLSLMGLMAPIHSSSIVIGLGKQLPKWTQADNCQICRAREKCAHRHEPVSLEECPRL